MNRSVFGRRWRFFAALAGGLLAVALAARGAGAGTVAIAGIPAGYVSVPVKSMQARKFSTTVRQRYDYSCGSAALATLLTYQYDDPVSEAQAFESMWVRGDQTKIRREGFSLLDIKHYLERRGYQANGYRASLAKLARARLPAIVLIQDHGYNHFVVIKGIEGNRVLIGDPAKGLRVLPRHRFLQLWKNGIVFVIDSDRIRAVFDGRRDWALAPPPPLGLALGPGNLANITLLRAGPNNY